MSASKPYVIGEDGRDIELRRVLVSKSDVVTLESLSDAAMRGGSYETAMKGYALALRLRSESGFHPLRRASDDVT